jgi:hypothetical protein
MRGSWCPDPKVRHTTGTLQTFELIGTLVS